MQAGHNKMQARRNKMQGNPQRNPRQKQQKQNCYIRGIPKCFNALLAIVGENVASART
jgi:hypothetical protein